MQIHLDEEFAKAVGLPGIIIHGLCTMAFTSVAAIEHACPDDPTRLKRLAVRFASIALPEQTITTRIWDAGERDGRTGYAYETDLRRRRRRDQGRAGGDRVSRRRRSAGAPAQPVRAPRRDPRAAARRDGREPDRGGYAGTTIRRVTELAGVSQGAQSHHFPHRVDLVVSAFERLAEQRVDRYGERARELSGDRASAPAGAARPALGGLLARRCSRSR